MTDTVSKSNASKTCPHLDPGWYCLLLLVERLGAVAIAVTLGVEAHPKSLHEIVCYGFINALQNTKNDTCLTEKHG